MTYLDYLINAVLLIFIIGGIIGFIVSFATSFTDIEFGGHPLLWALVGFALLLLVTFSAATMIYRADVGLS